MPFRRKPLPLLAILAAACLPLAAITLTPITIDGSLADWTAVLADPFQRSDDGPTGPLPDRDAPTQSTGRDLSTFAWTYDSSYLYFYVARVGSASNIQNWWFYLDVSNDGVLQSGEPVVMVSWKGSNRRTDIYLYSYQAAAAGGDPLGDASGYADGWDMPGSVTGGTQIESLTGGSSSGLEMESRISWSALGVPPGTAMQFHVASSNGPNVPQQIDDNMGGPGGQVGSTALPGVAIAPDRSGTVVPAGNGVLAHTVSNTGQGDDRANLTWSASGDFVPSAVAFFQDADGNGLLDAGDPQLGDSNGDGVPDTGVLAAGSSLPILVVVTAPAGVSEGQTVTVVVGATSPRDPSATATVTDLLTVALPGMTLVKSVDATAAVPGDRLTYTVAYTSDGTADAHAVVLVDAVPPPTIYVPGSAAGAGAQIEFSHDGGGTFDGSDAAPVTHIRWTWSGPLTPGATGVVSFQVDVP